MLDPLAEAILKTLNYADLFDYALTREQVFQFLIGARAERAEIDRALDDPTRLNGSVLRIDGLLALPRRQALAAARARWRAAAQQQMPRARFYARIIAHFPFARMVALTGGLAMENARDNDIDFLIVTTPRRLWLVRGFAVALVRLARLRGVQLCPNFFLSENALKIPDENLYSAHEIVQMVPFYGQEIYHRFRKLNQWTESFLPNANGADKLKSEQPSPMGLWLKNGLERALSGVIGDRIERWEMERKTSKLTAHIPASADAVVFSADVCRGFFSGHSRRVLSEYYARTGQLGVSAEREQ